GGKSNYSHTRPHFFPPNDANFGTWWISVSISSAGLPHGSLFRPRHLRLAIRIAEYHITCCCINRHRVDPPPFSEHTTDIYILPSLIRLSSTPPRLVQRIPSLRTTTTHNHPASMGRGKMDEAAAERIRKARGEKDEFARRASMAARQNKGGSDTSKGGHQQGGNGGSGGGKQGGGGGGYGK
ncbi:hypothetical protein QBC39DRAFT_187658, partial [Podospora conica]